VQPSDVFSGTGTVIGMHKATDKLSRFFSNYGMLAVLLLLCCYYSFATLKEQHPVGQTAAKALARQISRSFKKSATVVVVAKETEEGTAFAARLEELLQNKGFEITASLQGDPVSVRSAFEELAAQAIQIDTIATTQDYATVVSNIKNKFSYLAGVTVTTPRSYKWPTFLLRANLMNVSNQITVIAIVAAGMTMVIITAGIDLSVGSLIAFSAVVLAWLIRQSGGTQASVLMMALSCLAAMALCGAFGIFSGLIVTRFKIQPFIVTLGIMQIARGLAYLISRGQPIRQIPTSFVWLGRGAEPLLSIPYGVILMVIIYAAAHVVMTHTTFGRYVYAVGGNREAARLSGVNVNRILVSVYAILATLAGLGGVVMASQLRSGSPTFGVMYELYVIAAVVVGGTSLAGGEGKILGTLVGAFIIAVINCTV
jgi:ribose transport system permease protein